MLQQTPLLIVKISSSFSYAIFHCEIHGNRQTVKLNRVEFHSGKPRVQHQHARPYSCWLTPTWKIYTYRQNVR